jgi:hypothetical protein
MTDLFLKTAINTRYIVIPDNSYYPRNYNLSCMPLLVCKKLIKKPYTDRQGAFSYISIPVGVVAILHLCKPAYRLF